MLSCLIHPFFSRGFFVALCAGLFLAFPPVPGRAGSTEPPPVPSPAVPRETHWSLSLETSYLFQSVPNPFYGLAGVYKKNPLDYHLATQIVSARYRLTDTAGPGPLRGNLEISVGLLESTIVRGPESFYAGYVMGLRYTFVPKRFPMRPYIEARGALGWTDSRGFHYAQQQDFCFNYLLGAGMRYELNPRWGVTLGVMDQHISNAFLTSPNFGFDAVGVQLGLARQF